jgi:hypothetical protein
MGEEIPNGFTAARAEWLQLLMQIGYAACGRGRPAQALAIFEGIAAVRPNSELPLIGLSMALVNGGKLSAALKLLTEEALPRNPKSQITKVMCGMIHRMAGQFAVSDRLLDEVVADGTDAEATEFARQLKTENFSYLRSRGK